MRGVKGRHARCFVNAAALHAYKTVLADIDASDAIASGDLVQVLDRLERRSSLTIQRNGHTLLKSDLHFFNFVRRLLWRDCHSEIDDRNTIDSRILKVTSLVADVQAILIRAVRLRN